MFYARPGRLDHLQRNQRATAPVSTCYAVTLGEAQGPEPQAQTHPRRGAPGNFKWRGFRRHNNAACAVAISTATSGSGRL